MQLSTANNNPFDQLKHELQQDILEIKNLLITVCKESNISLAAPAVEDDIVEVPEACKITKYKTPTIYLFCRNNQIPHIKKGRKILFSRKALQDWINSGTQETLSSIQRKA